MRLDTFIKELQKLREKHGNLNLVYEQICDDDFTSEDASYLYELITKKPKYEANCNYIKLKNYRFVNVTEPVIVIKSI